jgi:hypothetical protein
MSEFVKHFSNLKIALLKFFNPVRGSITIVYEQSSSTKAGGVRKPPVEEDLVNPCSWPEERSEGGFD